jgi:hypothetical protein
MEQERSKMKKTLSAIFGMILLFSGADAAAGAERIASKTPSGFYIGAGYASLANPLFRYPSGSEQLSISGSAGGLGFFAGYDFAWETFGVGARLAYASGAFENFATPSMPGDTYSPYARYTDPKLSFVFLDLIASWYPARSGLVAIYGYLALGLGTESYTISNAIFADWNGSKSLTEFDYGFGFGLRVRPVRFISLIGDLRLIAGDSVTEYSDYLYSDENWNYYGQADTKTKYTTLFSFGLAVHF